MVNSMRKAELINSLITLVLWYKEELAAHSFNHSVIKLIIHFINTDFYVMDSF